MNCSSAENKIKKALNRQNCIQSATLWWFYHLAKYGNWSVSSGYLAIIRISHTPPTCKYLIKSGTNLYWRSRSADIKLISNLSESLSYIQLFLSSFISIEISMWYTVLYFIFCISVSLPGSRIFWCTSAPNISNHSTFWVFLCKMQWTLIWLNIWY